MNATDTTGWCATLALLRLAPLTIDPRERLRVALGVESGLGPGLPWRVAPIGASAVVVFGLPSSPLAQPWSVVGGNTASALVGVAVVHGVPVGPWSAAAPVLAGRARWA